MAERHATPDGDLLYRVGQRPGPGRYRCDLCGWVVQLDDDPLDPCTGPFTVTLEWETRAAEDPLPPCLGCGGSQEPIYERVADEPPEATSAFSPNHLADGTPVDRHGPQ